MAGYMLGSGEEKLLAKIQKCNISSHKRINVLILVAGALWGILLLIIGIYVDDKELLYSGVCILLVLPVIVAGRGHILLCYELIRKLNSNQIDYKAGSSSSMP